MSHLAIVIVFLTCAAVAATGIWRFCLAPLRINAEKMSAGALGFAVTDPADLAAVNDICRAFSHGFNRTITTPSRVAVRKSLSEIPPFLRPFAEEASAMGASLRFAGLLSPERFEHRWVHPQPEFAYLYYVGYGFWQAMRSASSERIARIVSRLDGLHGMLVWDGYGFKFGFFDFAQTPNAIARLADLPGYAAHVAHQGLGRSLWFRFLDDPERLFEHARRCEPFGPDIAGGVGLAAVFASFDRPHRCLDWLARVPEPWRAEVQLGMCFAYKARSLCDAAYFDRQIGTLAPDTQRAIRAAIERCDAIERDIRQAQTADSYRLWRTRLTAWLADNIVYPFQQQRPLQKQRPPIEGPHPSDGGGAFAQGSSGNQETPKDRITPLIKASA